MADKVSDPFSKSYSNGATTSMQTNKRLDE